MKALLCGFLAFALVSFLALADARSDSDDDFDAAVKAWLDDDDATALPIMARLARAGDERAMLFLGQLVQRPGRQSRFLSGLSTKERRKLIMAEGGISGISWLYKVEESRELANALKVNPDYKGKIRNIGTLLKHNETGQAIRLITMTVGADRDRDVFELSKKYSFPMEIRALLWSSAVSGFNESDPDDLNIIKVEMLGESFKAVESGTFQGRLFQSFLGLPTQSCAFQLFNRSIRRGWIAIYFEIDKMGNIPPDIKEKFKKSIWNGGYEEILKSEELEDLVGVCKRSCSNDLENCVMDLYASIGGYITLMGIQSPLEKLIPSPEYFQSKRYEADLFRSTNDWEMKQIDKKVGEAGSCMTRLHADFN